MKNSVKRAAVTVLAGTLAAGMLAGCGEAKKLDGTKTAATVNGTEIPLGVVSLYARIQQAQTDAMYKSFMGTGATMWDTAVDEESEETYGEQLVSDSLKAIETMVVMKEKAADYGVEVTEEDQKKMADAAAAFIKDNGEEVIGELAVTEDQVKMLLELQTYRTRMIDPISAEAKVGISDEEANQSAFSYVSISTGGEEVTEEDLAKKKEDAQKILDKVTEDPEADMSEIAKSVDESYSSLSGTFTTTKSDETEDSYPEEVMEVLRTLKEGEVCKEVIETDSSLYIVRLDKELDEEATETKRESLKETKENEYYQETTEKWLEEADVKAEEKTLKTLKVTNAHTFVMKMPEAPVDEMVPDEAEDLEVETEDADAAGDEAEANETAVDETTADAKLEETQETSTGAADTTSEETAENETDDSAAE